MWKDRLMKNRKIVVKAVAGILVVAMVGTGVGTYSVAANEGVDNISECIDEAKAEEQQEIDDKAELLADLIATQVGNEGVDVDKEENVFVVADANGATKDVIVSDWLKNRNGENKLDDVSELTDIKNVKGEEGYNADGESLVWDANGSDIYYQGHTNKELPVDVKITYYLDGVQKTPEQIAGKSGNVKIRFDYTNKQTVTENINGVDTDVYVPFTVMSALVLPADTFGNVSVTNGKVMSEGNNNIVMGLAFPGLTDSLSVDSQKLKEKDIEIPEYVEVNAVTSDFKLDMTLSVVLSDALSDIHLTDSIDLSDLEDSMDELTDATNALEDGTGALADGVRELSEKTGDFQSGSKELYDGVNKYTDGVGTLADGIGTLAEGTGKLSSGADALSAGAAELNSRVQEINLPKVELTEEQKKQIEDGVKADPEGKLAAGAQEMATQIGNQTTEVLTSNASAIVTDAVTAAISGNADVVTQIATALAMSGACAPQDAQETAINMLKAVAAQTGTETMHGVESVLGSDGVKTALYDGCKNGLTQGAVSGAMGGAEAVVSKVNSTMDSYTGMINELKEGTSKLSAGASELAGGVKQVDEGAGKLNSGVGELTANSAALSDGAYKLYDGTNKLSDGVSKLLTGANDLNDGMVRFDKEGISKLTDAVNGEGKEALDRLNATMDAAGTYHSFSGLAENKEGSVKFIIRTEAVK